MISSFTFDLGGIYMPGEIKSKNVIKLFEQLKVSAHSMRKAILITDSQVPKRKRQN